MNTYLQTRMNPLAKLLAAGFALSLSLGAMAADAPVTETPAMPAHEGHGAMHEEKQQMTPEQRAERRRQMREQYEKFPPEERARLRDEMRKKRDSMSPEQREARRREMRERWEKMSPEEREKMREKMMEYRKAMPPEGGMNPG